jgi:hypothetical protein
VNSKFKVGICTSKGNHPHILCAGTWGTNSECRTHIKERQLVLKLLNL